MTEAPPHWTHDDADSSWGKKPDRWIGKTLLVGITRQSAEGEVLGRDQFCGPIITADTDSGIELRVFDGSVQWVPPAFEILEIAPPGEYRLESTGEVIVDPDLLVTFIVTEPAED